MVLANCLKASWLLALMMTLASAQAIDDQVLIKKNDIKLTSSNGHCQISFAKQTVALNLTPPCRFLRSDGKTLGQYSYPKIGTVFLVVGAPAKMEALKKFDSYDIKETDLCSTEAQGIILQGKTLKAGIRDGSWVYCPSRAKDEKVYYSFAHP